MIDPSFFSYVTVMSITPGPNNLLLATSGVNFGLRRTLPMIGGFLLGCLVQLLLLALALDLLLGWMDAIRKPLTLLGCGWMLWLSWKIWRSAAPTLQANVRPMTTLGGALFQAVNPKAWLMVSNVALIYIADNGIVTVLTGYALLNLPCILLWAFLGERLSVLLAVEWKRRLFNSVMAVSLALTALWMLYEVWG
ncbi:threonine/homoserine/homoserine lactone efflux protein [Pantoea alhagi]|uniref:LysE family translocator n=1 Tax=Mixta sp. BE291 TaxID=3158787 RepID=UPI00285B6C58|nr:threonine/homoserine/homoserine lactone efflux protein [Pantoea alhagi]